MLKNKNGPKCQMSSFSGITSRIIPASKPDARGHRTRKPLVIAKRGQADERTAEKPDNSSADQAHQKRALERQIKESVTDQTKQDSDGQRRRQK